MTTYLNVCGLGTGNSAKKKEVKKQILRDKQISSDTLTSFVDYETKRLSNMKEKIAGGIVARNSEEDEQSVESNSADSDSEDERD